MPSTFIPPTTIPSTSTYIPSTTTSIPSSSIPSPYVTSILTSFTPISPATINIPWWEYSPSKPYFYHFSQTTGKIP